MEHERRFGLRAATLVTILVAATFATLFYVGAGPSRAGTPGATATRTLAITWDPATSGYEYSVTSLQVPLGAVVEFVITSSDTSTVPYFPAASDAIVSGTVGGVATVTADGVTSALHQVASNDLSHTFTIASGAYQVNVPIPAAPAPGDPVTVRFSVLFATPGSFAWGCVIPCGTDDMTQMGAMFGTLEVE